MVEKVKRRKVGTKSQVFQEKWTSSHFFTKLTGKRVCVWCVHSTFQSSVNILFSATICLIIAMAKKKIQELVRTTENREDKLIVGRSEGTAVCFYECGKSETNSIHCSEGISGCSSSVLLMNGLLWMVLEGTSEVLLFTPYYLMVLLVQHMWPMT